MTSLSGWGGLSIVYLTSNNFINNVILFVFPIIELFIKLLLIRYIISERKRNDLPQKEASSDMFIQIL